MYVKLACTHDFRYHQTSRGGMGRKKRKSRNDQKRMLMHHAVCDGMYTRVLDVLLEFFADT